MSSTPTPESDTPQPALPPVGIPDKDPYPKMIIVCFVIFGVLILVIFGTIALDMVERVDTRLIPPHSRPAPTAPGK
jgi:hypothetical protein